MTAKGLERVDKVGEGDNNDNNDDDDNNEDAIEQFRKSREQMEREKEQKIKELQEIEKELQKTTDSTRYRYRPLTPDTSGQKKTEVTSTHKGGAEVPNGISDMLMIRFPL
jgi:hypothetical protein